MDFFIKVLMALVFGVKRHWQILFAILLGFILGAWFFDSHWGDTSQGEFVLDALSFVSQLFIRLITMLVLPLVVSSLIVGTSSVKDARQLGRMGGKVFSFFLVLMILSTIIGAVLMLTIKPGELMQGDIAHIHEMHHSLVNIDLSQISTHTQSLRDLVLQLIPLNPVESLATMNLVPAIIYTMALGFALAFIGPAGRPLISVFESLFTATMKLTDWVMMLAVPGVFALAFSTVATSGLDVFYRLMPYAGTVLAGLLIQVVVVFPVLLHLFARVDAGKLYRAISEAILVAFGTASSSATLPITMANCEMRAGISNRVASFVLPTGASINKTATTMFEVIAVMFLAQAYGIPLEPATIGLIMGLAIIASIAAAAVPSAGMITMSLILTSLGKGFTLDTFASGIALLWAIDRVLDMFRTVTNVMSSVTVAAIVASSEGELRRDIMNDPSAWRTSIQES